MKEYGVIGLGNFGATVAIELTSLKCRVTAIDSDKEKVQSMPDGTHQVILANATERKFLEQLGVEKFECFVVSTGEDWHASILITMLLKELGARKIIVKAASADHASVLRKVGASQAIIPEKELARRLSHSLARPNMIDYLPLASEYHVAELVPPPEFIKKKLLELQLRSKYRVQVLAVKNTATGGHDFVPGGDYEVQSSDILIIVGKDEDIARLVP